MKNLFAMVFTLIVSFTALAEAPVLVIGASYGNSVTPINDNLLGPLGGISLGLGSNISLGDALTRNRLLSGYVINEARGGSTTFDRIGCNPVCNPATQWQGYDKQLTKALMRITLNDAVTGEVTARNGKYVIITMPNDCLHADAFGVEQQDSTPCTPAQVNQFVDYMVALGQRVLDAGLIPIFPIRPAYDDLDLPLSGQLFGLAWMIDRTTYEAIGLAQQTRIAAELPGAVQLNIWQGFTHLGDGTHPNEATVKHAAQKIAVYIQQHE